MPRNLAFTFLLSVLCCEPSRAVTFDWATVGNPGNADDTHAFGYGGVDYTYRISKHEVTNAQYTEFLNAVDPTGTNSYSLYSETMSSDALGGITFNSDAASGSKYEIKLGRDNNPVVWVSFFDAMRFVNWLENGQGSGGTESGVYSIGSGTDEVRNPTATYFVPTEDEWYKAAYYDPNNGVYYDYPTGTDIAPFSDNPANLSTPDDSNVANVNEDDGTVNGYDDGLAITGSTNIVSTQNYLTDVGAYSLATSPFGTYDQGGNVEEWNETVIHSVDSFRIIRGGDWSGGSHFLHANRSFFAGPAVEYGGVGFRVASVPEPTTTLMLALATAGLLVLRRR